MDKTRDILTAAQQDYVEVIFRLENEGLRVRVTDIASELGTRLPTVTRAIQRLNKLGLVEHETRQEVRLTREGQKIAGEIAHRHDDLVHFFVMFLGLPRYVAEADACQIEHGLSPATAQRFHEFLEYVAGLSESHKSVLRGFVKSASRGRKDFKNLPQHKITGWRR